MKREPRLFLALLAIAAMVALPAAIIIDVAATYSKWSAMAHALPVLSCLTGGLASFPKVASPNSVMKGFAAQALGAFLLLQVVMVGGGEESFAWTFGFWLFGALIWIPAYIWAFALFTLVFSILRIEGAREPETAMRKPEEVEVQVQDERLR